MATKRKRQSSDLHEREMTDNASAVRFVDRHKGDFRYVYSWKKWLAWDGHRWSLKDGENRIEDKARLFAASIWSEVQLACDRRDNSAEDYIQFARASNRKERIKAVIDLAQSDQRVAIHHGDLDADPYLFNCLNGTMDLKAEKFRDHQPEDLLTQVANVKYEPKAKCPLWRETLNHVFAGDTELIEYVQTLFGYSLSGLVEKHILPIGFGDGNNGKSTITNAFSGLMGDYAWTANEELLLPGKHKGHPTELASLFGRRFVTISEPEENCRLAEATVKALTGGDRINARRMYENEWQYVPTHKFWMSTNHKPKVGGTDWGVWRRIKLIPFTVDLADVVKVDPAYPTKLEAERNGILNWALQGWMRYQSDGLVDPQAVVDATKEYRSSEDTFGCFLRENYAEESSLLLPATEAYDTYKNSGGKMSQPNFGKQMGKRFDKERVTIDGKKVTVYLGIGPAN